MSVVAPPVTGEIEAFLRAQLDDIRADRDRWREMAERLAITDQRSAAPADERQRRRWFGKS